MLDPRIYRAAFVPVLFVLIVVGFSLREPPRPLASTLAPDAFDGGAAFAELTADAARFPRRPSGSAADRALAATVARTFGHSGFDVSTRTFTAQTASGKRTLQTVIGERIGFVNRPIVVLAHRDARAGPATAQLSGTAALLELARVLGGRTLNRTLILVSTSGGDDGGIGAERFAARLGGPTDAVLVLGDVAGPTIRNPVVVPFSDGPGVAPLALRRTVQESLRIETGYGGVVSGPVAQFARLALPLTLGEQGPIAAHGLPAVLVSASGERGPGAQRSVSEPRLAAFGRGVLRSITALDGGPDVRSAPHPYLVIQRQVLPAWTIRLLVASLILPALLAVVDGFARVRRRRHPVGRWLRWVLAQTFPFLLVAVFTVVLSLVGLLPPVPARPVAGGTVALDGTAIAALASVGLVLVLGWVGLRPLLARALGVRERPDSPGAAAAVALVLTATCVVAWALNPFAAALLLPALHGWLLVVVPDLRPRRALGVAVALLGLAPLVLLAIYYADVFGLSPPGLLWMGILLLAGGQLGPLSALIGCVVLGCFVSVLAIVWRRGSVTPEEVEGVTVRGPLSYAGPGSLGGTSSALRR